MTSHRSTTRTLADAIAIVEATGAASQRQDVRKAQSLFRLHGLDGASLMTFPCDAVAFEAACPKYRSDNLPVIRLVAESGLRPDTYKQLWRAARRLIDAGHVAPDAAKPVTEQDAWSELLHRMEQLQKVGLVSSKAHLAISPFVRAFRPTGRTPRDLGRDSVAQAISAATSSERRKLKQASRAFDSLRAVPALVDLLPEIELGCGPRQRAVRLRPAHLDVEIDSWVESAAREQVDGGPEAEKNSAGSRGVYQAALRAYVDVAQHIEPAAARLKDLFTPSIVDQVVTAWIRAGQRDERTHYSYAVTLVATLGRMGHGEVADHLHNRIGKMSAFHAGRAKQMSMSPKVKRWCRALLADPQNAKKFLTQHVSYYQRAEAAFVAARQDGIDLQMAADPAQLATLSTARRRIAKRHLQTAQRFGLMAAYSAIAIEGAPLRRSNQLSLRWTGPRKTFHDHLRDKKAPRAIIRIPVEELKNKKALLERGEELEPIEIRRRSSASCAVEILRWYLEKIRPLFGGAIGSDCLFPPLAPARVITEGLCIGTFDKWIASCSSEIGFPLTSHNYRHGQCTLYLADGKGSIEDLARLLGDRPETIKRYYGWIDSARSHARVQDDIARRMGGALSTGAAR